MENNIEKAIAPQPEQSAEPSWLSASISDAWSMSKTNAQEMRAQGSSRVGVAATTEFVAGASAVVGSFEMALGSIAIPFDAATNLVGLGNGRTIADDKAMIKDGAQGVLQSPIVAAHGIYSLFVAPEKQK